MDHQQQILRGILPVLPTPFTGSGSIDSDAMPALVEFAIDAGVTGVVFPGFASEVSELTRAERIELLEVVVRSADGRVHVVAGASSPTAAETVEYGRHALSLGVNHLMVQPPVELGRDPEPLCSFLGLITQQLPDARIILQNAPTPRGSDLAPETICEIANRTPQLSYVKEESLPAGPAISYLVKHRPSTLLGIIGGGGARYVLDEYARGACAANPALEIADLHVALDRAWHGGQRGEARRIYVTTLPLLTLQAVYRMRLTKHVLMRRGLLQDTRVRAAGPELDDFAIADIDANLASLGLFGETDNFQETASWATE